MRFVERLAHLFIPRHSNNHKARVLHHSSITLLTVLFLFYQGTLRFIPYAGLNVLGYSANISTDDVIKLTNEKRAESGLSPLTPSPTLQKAALEKGKDMIEKDYWAHVAPDGTEPWKFFIDSGYRYRYAGENLARDFSNPVSAVEAWIASPSHRDNILSSKYREIGVAVVEGDLAGVDTTIIVQFFGTNYEDIIPVVPVASANTETQIPPKIEEPASVIAARPEMPQRPQILISPFNLTRNLSVGLIAVLLVTLVVDGIIIERRKIVRVAGRSIAHMAFLGMILAIALIIRSGVIL